MTTQKDFWEDNDRAQVILKELNEIKDLLSKIEKVSENLQDADVALELLQTGPDPAIAEDLEGKLVENEEVLDSLEEEVLLSDKYDSNPVIMNIHPGAGGTESADWADMLLRMYKKWLDKKGFRYRVVDYLPGDEAGVKNVTLTIEGKKAYGLLKGEKGIHRLVRISPFDSSKRRHTSFASVDVIPLIEKDEDIQISKEDLKIETFRSSGPGGQSVNTTDSAVRVTHIPSGIVVSCQDEKSQLSNRQTAMQILRSKLFELEMEKAQEEIEKVRGEKKDIGWGNQIRSYILQPYQLIKDHRTDLEVGNVSAVLDGDLDQFIKSYLEKNSGKM